MTSTIPYVTAAEPSPAEWTPSVDVILLGAYFQMDPTPALVDSGADRTAIPKEWAPMLGIDLPDCREVTVHNCGTTRPAWIPPQPVEAIVAGQRVQLIPMFSDVRDFMILGRDLFLHFVVQFDERARELRLTPYPERVGLKEKAWD